MTTPNYSGSAPSISGTQGKISTLSDDDQDTVVNYLKALHGLTGGSGAPAWWTGLQNFPNTLWNVINGFGAVITGIGGTIATDISDTILTISHAVNTVTTGLTDIITGVGGTVATDVSNTIITVRNGVQATIDAIVQGLTGWVGSGHTYDEAQQSAATLAKQQADTAAAVAKLQQINSGYAQAGNSVFVDFSTRADASSIGSDFDQTYSGSGADTVGIVAGRVDVTPKAYANHQGRTEYDTYNTAETLTDYQRVTRVFGSVPSKRTFIQGLATTHAYGYSYIRARVAKTGTYAGIDCVMVIFSDHDLTIGCIASGVWTAWQTYTHTFQAGAAYSLDAGGTGGARQYRILLNLAPIVTYNEIGTVSNIGADYRRSGGGGQWTVGGDSIAGYYPAAPAAVAAHYMADNAAATMLGTIGKAYGDSATTLTFATVGTLYILNNFMTDVDYSTADLSFDSSIAQWTVHKKGNYAISGQMQATSTSKSGMCVLWKNGSPVAYGSAGAASVVTAVVPADPGDLFQLLYIPYVASTQCTGGAVGEYCYFAITRTTPDTLEDS